MVPQQVKEARNERRKSDLDGNASTLLCRESLGHFSDGLSVKSPARDATVSDCRTMQGMVMISIFMQGTDRVP